MLSARLLSATAMILGAMILGAMILGAMILGLVGQAVAQQQPLREAEDELVVPAFNRSVDDIEDADLLNAAGEEIGEVEEVLVDADGRVAAIVVDVDGSPGIGDKEVIIGLDQLELRGDDLVTSLAREQLDGLPRWED
jgi:hypothetical protein